jgi:hypothetical protein
MPHAAMARALAPDAAHARTAPLALGVLLHPRHGPMPHAVWPGPLALRWTLLALALRERHGAGHARLRPWGRRRRPAPTARLHTSRGNAPGTRRNPTRGPKARSMIPRNPHPPHQSVCNEWMDRAVGAWGFVASVTWGGAGHGAVPHAGMEGAFGPGAPPGWAAPLALGQTVPPWRGQIP